ncbi:MAG: T9SS type A sorting domain-containing protein [Crocinitomicaceae bacterium]|nr:T9SS type A sorting domain-containing protein [Crocinitomicaceae bacterium]
MKKIYNIALFVLGVSFGTYSQHGKAWNNWHFGWFASMEFTTGSPVATTGSGMISEEGAASYSDDQGNLLFYTNGGGDGSIFTGPGAVWNKNHEIMPNGNIDATAGCSSSPQSALVIPKVEHEYYLFTMGCGNNQGLRQSIVDMTLDNGLGDLALVGDPVFGGAANPLAECLTATRHYNGTDYWLIAHGRNNSSFYVFLVTSTGISGPTIYDVGTGTDNHGQMKITAEGDKIAYGHELFEFDKSSGIVSYFANIGRAAWGRCFSSSGRYLYITGELGVGNVYQYDLQSSNIAGSEIEIAGGGLFAGPMQLGPDLKIYVATYGTSSLGVINYPEDPGTLCDFVVDQIPLNSNCQLGLPNYIDSYIIENSLSVLDKNQEIGVFPNPTNGIVHFKSILTSKARITNIEGQELLLVNSGIDELDLSNFPSGIYLIHYKNGVERLIKQ